MPFEKPVRNESEENRHDRQDHEHHEEFELIPVSPLRRMEKRIDELEKTSGSFSVKEFYREMVDIIRMNQQLVEELAMANDALRIELSRLPARIEELVADLKELLSYIKASNGEEQHGGISGESLAEGMKPLAQKLDVLIETNKKIVDNNQSLLNVLDEMERRISGYRPPMPPPQMMRKPMPPSSSHA
jgi:regulator of replication initiation timing